jgi:hypothetical protein
LEDVEHVVKEMTIGKSLGLDGFTTDLFQAYWKIIDKEIWEVVEESHTSDTILQTFNATFITLILKERKENMVDKFIHIYLCNAIYKIITKVIANQLDPIMDEIIYPK